ncbi:MAG: hypothetical protein JW891_04535 [Candidatus Lokiarchaeota archaeon]|nr:hypothetical protein [Candidatus Lokiarchaeota archaeon]
MKDNNILNEEKFIVPSLITIEDSMKFLSIKELEEKISNLFKKQPEEIDLSNLRINLRNLK